MVILLLQTLWILLRRQQYHRYNHSSNQIMEGTLIIVMLIKPLGFLHKINNNNDTLHQTALNPRIIAVRKAENNRILSSCYNNSRNSSLYSCSNNQINSNKAMSFRDILKKKKGNIIKPIHSADSNEMMRNDRW